MKKLHEPVQPKRGVRLPSQEAQSVAGAVFRIIEEMRTDTDYANLTPEQFAEILKKPEVPVSPRVVELFDLMKSADGLTAAPPKIAEMILLLVGEMLGQQMVNFDTDRFENCEYAFDWTARDQASVMTPQMLDATLKVMAYAMVASTIGRRRGYPSCSAKPNEYLYGEDVFRRQLLESELFRGFGFRIHCRRVRNMRNEEPYARYTEDHSKMQWLLKQMVLTGALFGFIPRKDAVFMASSYSAVEWDWLFTDPIIAHKLYKRAMERLERD